MRPSTLDVGPPFSEGDPSAIQVLRYRLPAHGTLHAGRTLLSGAAMDRQFELLDRWGFTLITFEDYHLFREGELHLPRRPIIVTFDGEIDAVHRDVLPSLRLNGFRAVVFAPTGTRPVRKSLSGSGSDGDVPFDPDQLVALQNSGCEIGSLTCSNNPLGSMPADVVKHELYRSREILESVTGARVLTLAYPGGCTTAEVKHIAREAGYMFAVGAHTPHAVFGTDLFEIRRRTIDAATGTLGLALSAFAPGARLGSLGLRSISRMRRSTQAPVARGTL